MDTLSDLSEIGTEQHGKGLNYLVEIIPLWLVNLLSFITVFSVMMAIGTAITLSVCFQHIR